MSPIINNIWHEEYPEFELGQNAIHVWCVSLDVSTKAQIYYWKILSTDEKERANRFKFDKDRIKYIACRGALRQLLGHYLGKTGKSVKISYVKNGKPNHDSNLEFNVSHSRDWAVIGFTMDTILGIDIEYRKRLIEFEDIALRFFSTAESNVVTNSPKKLISQYFYNCWTRKEAFIKALGDGLSFPLDQFEVSCRPNDRPQLLTTKWDEDEVENWSLWGFEKADDYVGAVTIRGPEKELSYYSWNHESFIR